MRKAIALIELLFAMVIIAITLLAVPNLLSKTSKSANSAIDQEAISNASSYLDLILSSYWDENATEAKLKNPILKVQKEDSALSEYNSSGRRVGIPKTSSRKFSLESNGTRYNATSPNFFGLDFNDSEPDDIDDFNGRTVTLTKTSEATTVADGDYKDKSISIATSINYIDDNSTPSGYSSHTLSFSNPFTSISTTQSTNIKAITLTLTSTNDSSKKIVLKAFSCNIGSQRLKEREF